MPRAPPYNDRLVSCFHLGQQQSSTWTINHVERLSLQYQRKRHLPPLCWTSYAARLLPAMPVSDPLYLIRNQSVHHGRSPQTRDTFVVHMPVPPHVTVADLTAFEALYLKRVTCLTHSINLNFDAESGVNGKYILQI